MKSKHSSVFTFILFLAVSYPVSCGKKDSGLKEKCRICKSIAADFEKVNGHWLKIHRSFESGSFRLFFFFFYLLLRRSISDYYLRSCGYVTCSRPQLTATGGLEPGTSRPKVLGFTVVNK